MIYPDLYYDSIFHIPYERLYEQGKRGLIYDIDNTMAGYADKIPPADTMDLVNKLLGMGFQIGLLSNNRASRLNEFNKSMKLPGASMAGKPFTSGLMRVMDDMGVSPFETVMIGDQLFADVWCGKRAGITTVMVKPLTEHEILFVKLKRGLERVMLKQFLRTHVNEI